MKLRVESIEDTTIESGQDTTYNVMISYEKMLVREDLTIPFIMC